MSGKLKEEYGNSIYAVLSSLITSKKHIESNDFELGIQQLRWALSQDHGDSMEDLIRVRLARVLASSNKSDEAFLILRNYEPQAAHLSIFEETKGDIFFQVGNLASAREVLSKGNREQEGRSIFGFARAEIGRYPFTEKFKRYVDQAINEAEGNY